MEDCKCLNSNCGSSIAGIPWCWTMQYSCPDGFDADMRYGEKSFLACGNLLIVLNESTETKFTGANASSMNLWNTTYFKQNKLIKPFFKNK